MYEYRNPLLMLGWTATNHKGDTVMASIVKRKKAYSIVYNYTNETGKTKQKWETCHSHKEALKRKAEIETQQFNGTFIPPKKLTVSSFLEDFVRTY